MIYKSKNPTKNVCSKYDTLFNISQNQKCSAEQIPHLEKWEETDLLQGGLGLCRISIMWMWSQTSGCEAAARFLETKREVIKGGGGRGRTGQENKLFLLWVVGFQPLRIPLFYFYLSLVSQNFPAAAVLRFPDFDCFFQESPTSCWQSIDAESWQSNPVISVLIWTKT